MRKSLRPYIKKIPFKDKFKRPYGYFSVHKVWNHIGRSSKDVAVMLTDAVMYSEFLRTRIKFIKYNHGIALEKLKTSLTKKVVEVRSRERERSKAELKGRVHNKTERFRVTINRLNGSNHQYRKVAAKNKDVIRNLKSQITTLKRSIQSNLKALTRIEHERDQLKEQVKVKTPEKEIIEVQSKHSKKVDRIFSPEVISKKSVQYFDLTLKLHSALTKEQMNLNEFCTLCNIEAVGRASRSDILIGPVSLNNLITKGYVNKDYYSESGVGRHVYYYLTPTGQEKLLNVKNKIRHGRNPYTATPD